MKLRATGIEQDSGCSLVSIRDGRHLSSPLVKSFCKGDRIILPMTYFSSGRYLLVRYHSPSRFWWFTAEFEAVKQCKILCVHLFVSFVNKKVQGKLDYVLNSDISFLQILTSQVF